MNRLLAGTALCTLALAGVLAATPRARGEDAPAAPAAPSKPAPATPAPVVPAMDAEPAAK